jgi:hypothetical protein
MFRQLIVAAFLFCVASVCTAAPYRQLLAGYNGPAESETSYYSSPETARSSWLRNAVAPDELEKLISQVDFSTQLLAVSAIGEREAVTTVSLEGVNWTRSSVSVYVVIRIADTSCAGRRPTSYPFVVGVVERPAEYDGMSNFFHQNYPDSCGEVHEGKPTGTPPNNSSKPTPLRGAA